jgi:CubicO group peptidase (beta-lactamase class C family)
VPSRNAFHTAIVAILSITACRAQRPPEERALAARVDSLAKTEADAGRLSGIILVARGDRVILQQTWGFADWERRVPASPETRFGIGSITKVMTLVLVDQLAGDGAIDVNAPVARYLPGFPTGPNGGRPTVRDLLTHRAGVPFRVTTPLEETQHLDPADIVERVKAKALLFEPGTAELYSSAGFTTVARIVEVVANKPFDEVLAERIFGPASMTSATGETGEQLMLNRALPFRLGAGAVHPTVASAQYKDLGFLTGAGSLYTTAEDLLRFVRALHNGTFGSVSQKQLGAPTDTVWTGWYGRTNGYEASVDFLPAKDLTFIFLSNLRSAANWQIRDRVRLILRDRAVTPIASVPTVAPPFEPPNAIVGQYGDPVDPLVIAETAGRLFRDDSEFYPIAGDRYYRPASGTTFRFVRDSGGRADSVVTRFHWAPQERVLGRIR